MKYYKISSLIKQPIHVVIGAFSKGSTTVLVPPRGIEIWETQISGDVKTKVKNGTLKLEFLREENIVTIKNKVPMRVTPVVTPVQALPAEGVSPVQPLPIQTVVLVPPLPDGAVSAIPPLAEIIPPILPVPAEENPNSYKEYPFKSSEYPLRRGRPRDSSSREINLTTKES